MKIIVGIKHVPDTETKVQIHSDGNRLDPAAVSKWIISPFDEYAIEQALQLRGEGEVVLVCVGPESAQSTVRTGLAMGADRAILVADDRFDGAEPMTRARALAETIRSESPDLVLLGKYGVGTDEGQTGAMVAELLDWPHVGGVIALELADGSYTARRAIEGALEVHEGALPVLLTCDKGLNEPRYPSLKGIMQAKKKPLEKRDAAAAGVEDRLATGPRLVWETMELPLAKPQGIRLEGDAGDVAAQLVKKLHEEAKVL
ncbi:MAG: electron transfer flavoprotein subunit beta/FixA family protein [Acidobacteriota bacterium]|nr:electron transfer flavoprotein subunit beta/FixA family protein [Acidobacteriota bacterium]MDH3786809.1 electron transfer flavoprotein subunit beta/FixA family protein [Acidobacteriota bacterium]